MSRSVKTNPRVLSRDRCFLSQTLETLSCAASFPVQRLDRPGPGGMAIRAPVCASGERSGQSAGQRSRRPRLRRTSRHARAVAAASPSHFVFVSLAYGTRRKSPATRATSAMRERRPRLGCERPVRGTARKRHRRLASEGSSEIAASATPASLQTLKRTWLGSSSVPIYRETLSARPRSPATVRLGQKNSTNFRRCGVAHQGQNLKFSASRPWQTLHSPIGPPVRDSMPRA
jgi:hypothetical protein